MCVDEVCEVFGFWHSGEEERSGQSAALGILVGKVDPVVETADGVDEQYRSADLLAYECVAVAG